MKNKISFENKDNISYSQYERIEDFLRDNTASRYMAAIDTGIPIQNVCRYVDMMSKRDLIAVIRKDKCAISGEMVEFLSTNPDIFPKEKQLKFWFYENS